MSAVVALGLVTPLGEGEAFVQAWREGRSADFDELGARVGKVALRKLFPEQRASLRRMDRLSKLIVLGAARCGEAAGGLPEDIALGVGTDLGTLEGTWSFLNRLRDRGPSLSNPLEFPNLVPNAGAGYAGLFLGLRGPSQTFCQHETSGDEAIAWARSQRRCLVGGAEELGAIRVAATEAAACDPLPRGEGAAFLLLEQDASRAPLATVARCFGGRVPVRSPSVLGFPGDELARFVGRAVDGFEVGAVLASHPALHPVVAAVLPGVPCSDHACRLGSWPADGALRAALGALLLSDPTLPVHADGPGVQGDAALVLSVGRGGSVRATILTAYDGVRVTEAGDHP